MFAVKIYMFCRFGKLMMAGRTYVLLASAVLLVALIAAGAPAPEAAQAFAAPSKSNSLPAFETDEHRPMPADMNGFHTHNCHAPMKAFSVMVTHAPNLRQTDSFEPVHPVHYRSVFASLLSHDPPVPRSAI